MRNIDSATRRRVQNAARNLNVKGAAQSLAGRVKDLTVKTLGEWGAVTVPSSAGQLGLESFGSVSSSRSGSFNPEVDGNLENFIRGLKELNMSDRHIEQVAEGCLNLFDKGFDAASLLRDGHEVSGTHASMSAVIGRTSAGSIGSFAAGGAGMEAFGDDINRLNTDDRLTMSLMIMRPWENIMDKALARVNDSSPVVTIRIPSPEAWDWATTQQANSTSASRNGGSNTYRLRDLYRNPTPVNSQAKRIVALAANDAGNVSLWNSTTQFYKTGRDISLLDLSRDANRFTHDKVDRTDLVADGAILDNVIVTIKDPNSGSPLTEHFKLNTRTFSLAMFVISPSNRHSGQRQVMMTVNLPINSTTKQFDGSNSAIAAKLTDAKLSVRVTINANLNIQTGGLQASGSVQMELVKKAEAASISSATNTLFGNLTAELTAYSVEAYFDEENQRKANLAVWVQYMEQQFVVPRSRIYFTEYSLAQDVDENAIAATSSIVALGNGRRGLDIVVNALTDISAGLEFAAQNPEIASANAIDEQSFAAALVKPTVITTELNFNTEELNTMNESTRLTEIHGRFRARFLSMATMLFAKSLMLNQYKGGETPVIKAWVHTSIADTVIGILDYHQDLKDNAATASGADYSMVLPNGYRLDVIKSNFDCLQQRIYAVPVIESDMSSILSAASIRDCGTVTTNYTPTNAGAVVRRVATTSREIVMMSNKVGMCLKVVGIQAQLGAVGFTSVPLNADFNPGIEF